MLSRRSVENFIEQQLVEVGWDVKTKKQVIKNVSIIPRDRDIKLNYLLLNQDEQPIAFIIVNEGIKLNLEYKKRLLSSAKKLNILCVFLVLGNNIYFWDFQNDDARIISSFYSQKDLERLISINERERHDLPLIFKLPEISDEIQRIHGKILNVFNRIIMQGKKEFNVHLAPGSGKTVLTMSMINNLFKHGQAMKILIVTSRMEEARQIKYYLTKCSINSSIVSSWVGKEDLESNFNEIYLGTGIFISTIHTIMNRDFQVSSGMFDTVIFFGGIQLQSISNLRKNLGLDALYINFASVPFNTEAGGEKLDFSFGINQAIDEKILSSFEVIQVNIKSPEYKTNEKKELLHLDVMKCMQKILIDNVEPSCNTKTIVVASNIEEAQRIVEYLNNSNSHRNIEYARLLTSNLKSEYLHENIQKFRTEVYPQILVSVNLVGMGLQFNNVANLVLLNKFYNPIFLYNLISNVLLSNSKDKKVVKIYDFFENEKVLDLLNVNMMEHETSQKSISKIIQKNVKETSGKFLYIEIVEKGVVKKVSKLEFVEMWESFVQKSFEEHDLLDHGDNSINDKIIEVIQNSDLYQFNETNLSKAYEVDDKIFSDFIWYALNNNTNRNERWNNSFDVWVKGKKFTEMQFNYIFFIKNIGINSGGIALKDLVSNKSRASLNLVGLGRKLFGHEELEQIIKELNENVFKNFK
ncbi:type I restriction-modification enzyme R subunit C-terminal domain-containing protein [Bacillus toyonensis]|uniref:type I restriction-modification enzyme R subunit C-terminal domain-containing protein n=1 Tax=Bacillus toyonensis TaxID=155322 RepID=UPI000BEBC968|nr:type I restriction-modification enzyme R subunit C-terminal domain-containing protein [Bacillus toyonensis]PDY83711.1 hypothetical protein CON67_30395 [Bacillus toyonensis]